VRAKQAGHFPLFDCPMHTQVTTNTHTQMHVASQHPWVKNVQTFKLLGVIISSDLTWNAHVDYICTKASKRLYALRILKRSGAPANDLITVFCSFIRPVLEYAWPVWYFSLPQFLADQIESIQKRALKIAFPQSSYAASLRNVGHLAFLHFTSEERISACHFIRTSINTQTTS
jgi:hypothetical protein